MIGWGDSRGISGHLYDVVEHHPLLLGDGCRTIVRFERGYQRFIECDTTQKLCVRFDSIMTPIGD